MEVEIDLFLFSSFVFLSLVRVILLLFNYHLHTLVTSQPHIYIYMCIIFTSNIALRTRTTFPHFKLFPVLSTSLRTKPASHPFFFFFPHTTCVIHIYIPVHSTPAHHSSPQQPSHRMYAYTHTAENHSERPTHLSCTCRNLPQCTRAEVCKRRLGKGLLRAHCVARFLSIQFVFWGVGGGGGGLRNTHTYSEACTYICTSIFPQRRQWQKKK